MYLALTGEQLGWGGGDACRALEAAKVLGALPDSGVAFAGARLKGAAVQQAGIATHFVAAQRIPDLIQALSGSGFMHFLGQTAGLSALRSKTTCFGGVQASRRAPMQLWRLFLMGFTRLQLSLLPLRLSWCAILPCGVCGVLPAPCTASAPQEEMSHCFGASTLRECLHRLGRSRQQRTACRCVRAVTGLVGNGCRGKRVGSEPAQGMLCHSGARLRFVQSSAFHFIGTFFVSFFSCRSLVMIPDHVRDGMCEGPGALADGGGGGRTRAAVF
jgi:hypothetical protein